MALSDTEIRAALAWETQESPPPSKPTYVWLWESIQGDFNDNRSTGQIAFDAGISMIPGIDQICDVRDIIANCKSIAQSKEGEDNSWKWVCLALTLIGLIPTLGSVVKGVLKIMFTFIQRFGINQLEKALDASMTWVITFLRKREVQKWLRRAKVDEVFKWLAESVRKLQGEVSTQSLLAGFDKGITQMKQLLGKVADVPVLGKRARDVIALVERIRAAAPQPLAQVDAVVQRILGAIARRFEMEHLLQRHGILNANNVHFRGTLPEAQAVSLMRTTEPMPSWLSKGQKVQWAEQNLKKGRQDVDKKVKDGWDDITDRNIVSFHKMAAVEIKGPAKLYRVVSPSNMAMGDCWVPEDVWQKILSSPDPKAAWRKYSAVWPDWNPNGQFVVLEVPPGETIKAWRGPAASQVKDSKIKLDAHLEGGWDQVIFKPKPNQFDSSRYYKRGGKDDHRLQRPISREEFSKLPRAEQAQYTVMREKINHPGIRGPFDSGWGDTDFDSQLSNAKIGLPSLPGQVTN